VALKEKAMASSKSGATELGMIPELSTRELETLKFIVHYQRTNKFHQSPSHRELMEHLNGILPAQRNGGPAISSTVQTHRIAIKLRSKGLLVPIEATDIPTRNMVLTPKAVAFLRKQNGETAGKNT
jgi:hypothetical protein